MKLTSQRTQKGQKWNFKGVKLQKINHKLKVFAYFLTKYVTQL